MSQVKRKWFCWKDETQLGTWCDVINHFECRPLLGPWMIMSSLSRDPRQASPRPSTRTLSVTHRVIDQCHIRATHQSLRDMVVISHQFVDVNWQCMTSVHFVRCLSCRD